jgi:hypothetical protein
VLRARGPDVPPPHSVHVGFGRVIDPASRQRRSHGARRRFPTQVGYTVECNGAWLRAEARGSAMVLTASGDLEDADLDALAHHLRRFLRLRSPLVVVVDGEAQIGGHVAALFDEFGAECRRAGVEWHLVVGDRVEL